MTRDVAVIGFDGACLGSIGLFLDLLGQMRLRVANQFRSRDDIGMQTRIRLLGPTPRPVQVLGGCKLPVEDGLVASRLLYIHVPDFFCSAEATAKYLASLHPVIDWLCAQYAGGATLSATGRGIELLAEAGLVQSGPVPLTRGAVAEFRARYPHIRANLAEPITEVGRIMMARGMSQELGLLTRMIGRLLSPTMAGTLADAMGMEADRPGLSDDPLIAAAQMWLSERASRGLQIAALAEHLAVSPQTLIRRFRAALGMTPRDYLRLVRMKSAQLQLRDTNRRISQIATLIGYNDLKSFQLAFREHSGMSASEYRTWAQQEKASARLADDATAPNYSQPPLILC